MTEDRNNIPNLREVNSGDWRPEFPVALKPLTYCDHWVIWRWETRQGKRTKVPYQARQPNRKADTGDGHTWATFAEARAAAPQADGIGFVLTGTDFVAFDIDDCRDAQTGELHPWATNLIARANSYTEVTVSGTGMRIIGIGTGPELHKKKKVPDSDVSCEIYRKATRYIVMTGDQIGDKPFANIDAVIDATLSALDGRRGSRPDQAALKLDDVIRNGRYDLFQNDRSRAVWWVANEAVRQGKTDEEIVALLLDQNNRISEHIYAQGNPRGYAENQIERARAGINTKLMEFVAYRPQHNYIFMPNGEMWPASSVDAQVGRVPGQGEPLPAHVWLDTHRGVEQMTWAPGEPVLIKDKLIIEAGWFPRPGSTVFNLYKPSLLVRRTGDVSLWRNHIVRLYGDEGAKRIIRWFAHRVQRPHEKINHAQFLGGPQGIGKDTFLEPVKRAVGPWNFQETTPSELMGEWTGFYKGVILRVNEAHDQGDFDRFKLYDRLKAITAAPPDVLKVNEKHIRQYCIPNLVGVVITSNHRTDGLYLPADDRRNDVHWTDSTKEDFLTEEEKRATGEKIAKAYWERFWRWYDYEGGDGMVADYLWKLDLSDFNPKAPPPKTAAFWNIVSANQSPEDIEMCAALDLLDWPKVVITDQLTAKLAYDSTFRHWLEDRRNAKAIPHRLEAAGYIRLSNLDAKDSAWKIDTRRRVVYAKKELSTSEALEAMKKAFGPQPQTTPEPPLPF